MNHVIREKRNLSGPFLKTNNKRQFDDTSYIFLYRLLIKLASTFYKYVPIIYPNNILYYYCSIILSNVVVQNFTQSIETRASPIVHSCLELKQEPLIMMRMAPYFHTKKVGKKLPRL